MKNSMFSARAHIRSRGFSMVELMVALVVGLFLVGAMITVLMTSAATGKTRERASDLQNNGRFALDLMKRDIQHAGFRGYTSVLNPDAPVAFAVANVCDSTVVGKLSLRVWAENKDNPYKDTCIPENHYVEKTDVLVVRHLSPNAVAAPFKSDLIYFRSAYEGGVAFAGGSPPGGTDPKVWSAAKLWTDAVDYQFEETVYYISRCTAYDPILKECDPNEKPRIPALYRLKLTNGPKMEAELVASGIENLQIRARETISLTTSSYLPPAGVTDWGAVTAIEVSLLARASVAEPGFKNKDTYTMGNEAIKVGNDGYRREVFSSLVYLRN